MTTQTQVFQGKFGYFPCSLETYKKLRFLNMVFAKAQHMAGAWERWERKQPKNRVIKRAIKNEKGFKIGTEVVLDDQGNPIPWSEPQICTLFHETIPSSVNRWGSRMNGCAKDKGLGKEILEASRQAKMPKGTPEEVQPLLFSDSEIDFFYLMCKDWLENR